MFHLWRRYNERNTDPYYCEKMVDNQKANRFVCLNGMVKRK